MNKKIISACVALGLSTINAYATPAKPATVQQLIAATNIEQTVSQALQQLKPVIDQQILQQAQQEIGQPLNQRQQDIVKQLQVLTWQQVSRSSNWQDLQKMMIEVYQKHFTEEELQATLRFYQSPEGRSMLQKTPLIMQEMMQNLHHNITILAPSSEVQQQIAALNRELLSSTTGSASTP